jgi:hypothetical protein
VDSFSCYFSSIIFTGVTRDTFQLFSSLYMVIKLNRGIGISVLPDVLAMLGQAETSPGDPNDGGGASGLSNPVVSSICIDSGPLDSPRLSIGS